MRFKLNSCSMLLIVRLNGTSLDKCGLFPLSRMVNVRRIQPPRATAKTRNATRFLHQLCSTSILKGISHALDAILCIKIV
jgi:hypothetical protein